MTRPDPAASTARFALFASGAPFSVYVFEALLRAQCLPQLIAKPGYPAATEPAAGAIVSVRNEPAFDCLVRDLPQLHVARNGQRECAARLRRAAIDFLLVACWPWLIQPELYQSPRRAALNLHPSLLPRYRGPDPVTQQLARRESGFGVSLHRLDRQFDHGPLVAQEAFEVAPEQRERDGIERICAARGVQLFIAAMQGYADGWDERPQVPTG